MKKWKKSLQKKTYVDLYNGINQEICKFNNDLNQVSCKLSDRYIGYIQLSVVQMIWKICLQAKIQENNDMIEMKKKAK